MNRNSARWPGLNHWMVLGMGVVASIWFGMSPSGVQGGVPPLSSPGEMPGIPWALSAEPNRAWSAFRSDDAKGVCVTVMNYGSSEIFVHLFRKRSLAGAFTVLPQRTSAMCSDVTVIELECGTGSCLPQWYISDSD